MGSAAPAALSAVNAGLASRAEWLAGARAISSQLCRAAEAVLQFEYSRQGVVWSAGAPALMDAFAPHCDALHK